MSSDNDVGLAYHVGLALTLVSLGLLLTAVFMRMAFRVLRQRSVELQRAWFQPMLMALGADGGDEAPLPAQRGRRSGSHPSVLQLWLSLKESLEGPSGERLTHLFKRARLDEALPRLLRSIDVRERVLAVAIIGHLRDDTYWKTLSGMLGGSPTVSLLAARALVQIDSSRALDLVLPAVVRRTDWPAPAVASMLTEAAGEELGLRLSKVIDDAIAEKRYDTAARIVGYLATVCENECRRDVGRWLVESESSEVRAACLAAIQSSGAIVDLATIRQSLDDANPRVRGEAALTLGRLCGLEAEPWLISALEDSDRWVQYRAAQGLSYLPGMTTESYSSIRRSLPEGVSREVMAQVVSEEITTAAVIDTVAESGRKLGVRQLREYLAHPNWRVRLQAIDRLSLANTLEDQSQLAELTGDARWWMRYDAAKELARLPFFGQAEREVLLRQLPDPKSRAMFHWAFADVDGS